MWEKSEKNKSSIGDVPASPTEQNAFLCVGNMRSYKFSELFNGFSKKNQSWPPSTIGIYVILGET